MTSSPNPIDPSDALNRPVYTRNPLPLSAKQEGQVKDLYYKNVRAKCADEIKEFAACAVGRTLSATWKCRTQRLAMNSCMVVHATQDELDKAREEWFATRVERRKQLQREEAEYQEKLKIKHQMWGVDDQGRPLEKKGYDSAGVLE